MKKKTDISVFVRYFISYLGIALFFCAVLGMVIFGISVRELNAAAKSEQTDKLLLASKDLQNQFQVMRNMSYIIQTTFYYNKLYLEEDPYNEIELVKDFSKYKNYSQIADDYFLLYHDSDWIFRSDSKTPFNVFAADYVGVNTIDTIYTQLNKIDNFTVITPTNDVILIAMPIYPSGLTGTGSEATLCFVIKKQTIINRITNVAGEFSGKLQIYYKNNFVSGEFSQTKNISSFVSNKNRICDHKSVLAACSPDRFIAITLDIPLGGVYDRMGYFRMIGIFLLSFFALVSIVLAWFVSYRNYKPIQQLVKKYRVMQFNQSGVDEIHQLEEILLSTLEKSKISQKKIDEQIVILNEQRMLLKRQLLLLILSGEYHDGINQKAELLNIEFLGPFYCVLTIKNTSGQKIDDEKLIDSVENLSGNNLRFYALKLEDANCIAVLLSLSEPGQINDAIELINALEDAIGMSFKIGRGEVCDNIKSIPISLLFALSAENADLVKDESITGGRAHSLWYNETTIKRMVSAVKSLNLPETLAILDEYFDDLQADYPSILAQCGIVSDVINTIIHLSMELGAPLPEKSVGAILILQDTGEFKNEIKKLLTQLVTQLEENKRSLLADQAQKVKDYLLKHALDYEISIEIMAKEIDMPIKQINSIIKSDTGYTYKDYLIILRMESAKKFLVNENLTVTETSERVGYAKVSYFICTFKNYTGYTPANYKLFRATHPDQM